MSMLATPSQAKSRLVFHVVPYPLESSSGHSVLAGVNKSYPPWFGVLLVDFHVVVAHVEGYIGHVQEVIREILLDNVALVTTTDDEIIDSVGRVDFHDVPK